MKTARLEPLKSRGGDRLLLGGGCLFEHGRKLNAFFREERGTEGLEGLGGEEGKWGGDRRDKKAGEEGKEQGRRERRKGKKKGLKMRSHIQSWCHSHHMLSPRKGSSQGGRGRGRCGTQPSQVLSHLLFNIQSSTNLTPGRARAFGR